MKDDKNKNKKDNTLLYLILGFVAFVVWVQFDNERQAQAQAAYDLEMGAWYYYNYMQ